MDSTIFISYAREVSGRLALALYEALGGDRGPAFLDNSNIEWEQKVPEHLRKALLQARVFIVLASEEYFKRRYCLWELRTALLPFSGLKPGAEESEKIEALEHILVVLPPGATGAPPYLSSLPPALEVRNLPTAENLQALADWVHQRLETRRKTLEERLRKVQAFEQRYLQEELDGLELYHPPKVLEGPRVVYPSELNEHSNAGSFVGRADELYWIHFNLSVLRDVRKDGMEGAPLGAAIYAGPGFGKTRLAWEYFRRYGPKHYPGGLFWVNAGLGEDELRAQFHAILRKLLPEDKVKSLKAFRESKLDAAEQLRDALTLIGKKEHQRILFVADGIPEPSPGNPPRPLEVWCPAQGAVSLLVTSRSRQYLPGEDFHAISLSTLRPEAAVSLLRKDVEESASLKEDQWRRIAERVGYLPLALNLLRCTLLAKRLSPSKLFSLMSTGQGIVNELSQLASTLSQHVSANVLEGVEKAFSLSYEKLSPPARRAARLVAQLAPEPVPLRLLESLAPKLPLDAVRMELSGRHFVSPQEPGKGVEMLGSMHLLMADFLRSLSHWPAAEQRRVGNGLRYLLAGLQQDGAAPRVERTVVGRNDGDEGLLLEACLPHAEHVLEQLMRPSTATWLERLWLIMGAKQKNTSELIELGEAALASALERGSFQMARRVGGLLLEDSSETLEPTSPDMLGFRESLAKVLRRMGGLKEAAALQEEVLNLTLRVSDKSAREPLLARMELAVTYMRMGRLSRALDALQLVYEEMQKWKADSIETLTAMSHLAEAYRQSGELLAAKQLQESALKLLPDALKFEQEYQAKLPETQRRNWIRKRLDEIPDIAGAKAGMALTLKELGSQHLREAMALEREVFKKRYQELGRKHPDTLVALCHLAETLRLQGRVERAKRLNQIVWKLRRRELGEEHPETLAALKQLAMALSQMKEATQARGMLEQVLKGQLRIWGEEHPETLATMGQLSEVLRVLEDPEALVVKRKELAIRTRIFEEMDRRRLMAILDISVELRKQGKLEQAQERQEQLLRRMVREAGDWHPVTMEVKSELAKTFRERQRLIEAIQHQKEVLEFRRHELAQDHPLVLDAMVELATTHYARGEYWYARRLEEEVLEVRRRVLGPTDAQTLEAACRLAKTCHALGEWEDALELLLEVWKLRQPLGASHPLVVEVVDDIAAMLKAVVSRAEDLTRRIRMSDEVMETLQSLGRENLAPGAKNFMDSIEYSQEEVDGMQELLEKALTMAPQFLGQEHKAELGILNSLVAILLKKHRYLRARELADRALKSGREKLGEDELETLTAMYNAALLAFEEGDNETAGELLQKVADGRRQLLGNRESSLETYFAEHDFVKTQLVKIRQEKVVHEYAQLQGVWCHYARQVPGGEVIERPEVLIASCNISWPVFNAAFLPTSLLRTEQALETAVAAAVGHFLAHRKRWVLVVAEELIAPRVRFGARDLLARYELAPAQRLCCRVMEKLNPVKTELPSLEIREITEPAGRDHLVNIIASAEEQPREVVSQALAHEAFFRTGGRAYVGYHQDKPITCVVTILIQDTVCIPLVVTLPAYRRQLYAEAVVRHALAEAYRHWGMEKSMLFGPPEPHFAFFGMGYRRETDFVVYLSREAPMERPY